MNTEMNYTYNAQHQNRVQHWFEEILEASFDGIMVTDNEGTCIFVNSSYTRNTGIKSEDILGHNMRELINPVWMKCKW